MAVSFKLTSLRPAPAPRGVVFRPFSTSLHQCTRPDVWGLVVAQAKGKGGKKGGAEAKEDAKEAKGSSKGAAVDYIQLAKDTNKDADERMQKCLAAVAENFNTIRTGRANPAILDKIVVDYFGATTPLKAMGSITVPDSQTLMITPFDRASIKDIERALQESQIGLNPSNDGERIRLMLPQLTQERRKEFVKQIGKLGEDGKIAIRNVRKDVIKKAEKYEFPKDDKKALEDSVQKVTDGFIKKVDDMVKAKSDELMKV